MKLIECPDLWKIDLELFTKASLESDRQRDSLPEPEVIEWMMQHGYTFEEIIEMRSELKGDSRFKCWN
jgi:hypothetical protein